MQLFNDNFINNKFHTYVDKTCFSSNITIRVKIIVRDKKKQVIDPETTLRLDI